MKKQTEKNIFQEETRERPARKSVHFPVDLIVCDKKYAGNIINISLSGVAMFVNIHFPEKTIDCKKSEILTLEVQSPLEKLIELKCKIIWLRFQPYSDGITTTMGMKIVDPPEDFIDLYNRL